MFGPLAASPAQAQDMRLSTDCRLNRYSLPCLGYDMETARRMVQEQDKKLQQDAADARRRSAEDDARQQAARNAPVPRSEYGPEQIAKGPWTILCQRNRMSDAASCGAFTGIRGEQGRAEIGLLHLSLLDTGFTLQSLLRGHRATAAQFRIDSGPPQPMAACDAAGNCSLAVTLNSALHAALRQGDRITFSFDGEIAVASLGYLSDALAELQHQSARWSAPIPSAKPKAPTQTGPASPTPSPWRRLTDKDAITDAISLILWTPAISPAAPSSHTRATRQLVLTCPAAPREVIVFLSLPATENPVRPAPAWPAARLVTMRVDQRPPLDLLVRPIANGGAEILLITPERLALLEHQAAGLPPSRSSSLQEITAPNGAAELMSELSGGKQLIARIETASGRLDLRFDISGFESARQHLAPCLK